MSTSEYIIPPPNVPLFLFNRSSVLRKMIEWAKKEHAARIQFCADRGYYRELKRLNEDYSPKRVLAEVSGFRRICAQITDTVWNELTSRERVFIRRSFEIRRLLARR